MTGLNTFAVNGTLKAVGTASAPIIFTSARDDSAGGDTNGDGPSQGAPGDWWDMEINGSTSQLSYIEVRYAGYGSSSGYGALVFGGGTETIDHVTVTRSQNSGIVVNSGETLTVLSSTILRNNAWGINVGSVNTNGILNLSKSTVTGNGGGVHFFIQGTTPPASTITKNDIVGNNGSGVDFLIQSLPSSSWPRGNYNNIFNNNGSISGNQMTTFYGMPSDIDWKYNYWGPAAYWRLNAGGCSTAGYPVAYIASDLLRSGAGSPPPYGPTPTSIGLVNGQFPWCATEYPTIGQNEFYTDFAPGAPTVPIGQTIGCLSGIHAVNPSGCTNEPVNTLTGSYTSHVVDASIQTGLGLPFSFERYYASDNTQSGRLGPGWSDSYSASLSIASNGDVTLHGEDGQVVQYVKQPDGSFSGGPGIRSMLKQVTGGYDLVRHDQVVYHFDSSGRLLSMLDRNGERITLSYNGSGQLAQIADAAGRQVTLSYANGLLSQVLLLDGRHVDYGYTNGRLTSVGDLRGGTTHYGYDGGGRLATITDQNQNPIVTNTYGSDGRITQQQDGRSNLITYQWDAATQTSTFTDARLKVWKDVYSKNMLVKRIDPLGDTTVYAYDDDANVTSIQDPRGYTTTMSYDSAGNRLTITPSAPFSGNQQTFTYDGQNNLRTWTDGRQNQSTYDYDSAGNLITITRPGAIISRYGRDPAGTGLLTSITDPSLKKTQFGWDAAGDLTSVTTQLGFVTSMGYDGSGRMTSMVDPRGNLPGALASDYTWHYTYDNADHLHTRTDPLGHTSTVDYDPAGNLQTITDANTHATRYGYWPDNHLKSVTAPDGTSVTAYDYDPNGNLLTRTDANQHTTNYTYDDANRLSSIRSALGQLWTYSYDADGNLSQVVDANGNATATAGDGTTTFTYDELDRLINVPYSDGTTPTVQYGYDGNGNLTSLTDGGGTETYVYDALNRLRSATRGTDAFSYLYDDADNVIQKTYPDSTIVSLGYDDDERLSSLTSGGATTSYGYDAAGRLTSTTLPATNGYVESRTYDRAGRLTDIRSVKGSSTLSSFTYTLDNAGNPLTVTGTGGTTTYQYDALDRLADVCFQTSCPKARDPFIRYTYDPVGNIKTEARPSGTTSYGYNAGDELTSKGTTTYGYNDNGDETAAGSSRFSYDMADRLTSATVGGTTTTYAYAGDGRRLKATQGSSITNYLWDESADLPQLALERDGSNNLLRRYLNGPDPLSMTTGGATYYYHHDGLGSIANVTSATGAAQWTYGYEPFGTTRTETKNASKAPTNLLRFTGQLYDTATSLYDLRARQYDPASGRFLSLDPLAQGLARAPTSHYVYASDRPTVLTDPSGLCGWPTGPGSDESKLLRVCLQGAAGSLLLVAWEDPAVDVLELGQAALDGCYEEAIVELVGQINPQAGRIVKFISNAHTAYNIGKKIGKLLTSAPRTVAPTAEQPIRIVYHVSITVIRRVTS